MTLVNTTPQGLRASKFLQAFAVWLCSLSLLLGMAPAFAAPTVTTSTALTSATNPVNVGAPTVLTATVTGSSPTGNVTFKNGTAILGTAALDGSGDTRTASFTATITTAGAKSLTAVYAGDALNKTSASTAVAQTVNKLAATATLQSATNPVTVGAPTVLIATITGYAPTGNVTFKNGTATLGTVALSGTGDTRTASFTATITTAGDKSLTAVYAGNTNNLTATSTALTQTVNKTDTTASVVTSQASVTQGQSVTFTATVSGYNPTGNVVFKNDTTTLATKALSGTGNTRTASYANTTLPAGVHNITVDYVGNANNNASSAPAIPQTIAGKAATTTALASDTNPSNFGQGIALTATVTGTNPTGNVTFKNGSAVLGTVPLTDGVANFSTSTLATGPRSLTAVYGGDTFNAVSSSTVLVQTVNKLVSTASLESATNPVAVGAPTVLTATITGNAPTGNVSFKNGTATLGTVALSGTGDTRTASFTATITTGGDKSLTAVYAGNTNNLGVTSAVLTQVVGKSDTTATLTSSQESVTQGQSVTFTATVTGYNPAGNVVFKNGTTTLGTKALSGTGNTRTAAYVNTNLVVGVHSITAEYVGNASNNTSSSGAITQTILSKAATTTALTSDINPSNFAQNITLTANVTAVEAGSNNPTGTVSFKNGSAVLGTASLTDGVANFSTSALLAGTRKLTAVYNGDVFHAKSTSALLNQVVNPAVPNSTTDLSSDSNPAAPGTPVTFMAYVNGNAPTGTVTFKDGANVLGTATLIDSQASFTANALSIGTHGITAVYAGDANNPGSTSSVLLQTVGAVLVGTPMTWQYGYDAMGRPTISTDPYGRTVYTYYDSLGRPIQTQQSVGGEQSITQLAYDGADNLTKVTDPRSLETTYSPTGAGTVTSQTSPDTGTAGATFDAEGNPLSKTDARGKTTTFTYDKLRRLTKLDYATGIDTTFEYDGGPTPIPGAIGELTKRVDESGQTNFAYDTARRLISKTQASNGKTFTVNYAWGDSGASLDKLTAITYPSGTRVNYSYDLQGSVSEITVTPVNANGVGVSGTSFPLISGVTFNASGAVTGWSWASGKTQTFGYDLYGQLNSYQLGDATGAGASAGALRTIGYDGTGRITAYTHTNNSALDQSFAYDDLARLTGASLGSSTIQYSYDLTGNRTSKVISGTAYNNTVSPTSNKLTQTQDVGGTTAIQYDAVGNITNDGVNIYTYSDRGRLSSVTTVGGVVNYRYNGFELRAYKTGPTALIPTGAAYYVYDESGKLLGEYDANGVPIYETIYLGSSPVGVLKQTGTAAGSNIATSIYNVYADHLATPRVITRATDESIVWRWDAAEAFGATAPDQNPNNLGTFVFNQRLPGQVFDAETGLFQNHHREYNARLGRYIQSDPIGLAGGINTYAYVEGNPLSLTDPEGLLSGPDLTGYIDPNTLLPIPGAPKPTGGAPILNPPEMQPDAKCMQEKFDEWFTKYGSSAMKEFSVLSLYPNAKNIDGHPAKSAALTAAGVAGKMAAYPFLKRSSIYVLNLAAKALGVFGQYLSLPLTAAATAANVYAAEQCNCAIR